MEELESVEVSDILSSHIRAQQEELDAIFAKFLHQKGISRVSGILHTQHTDQVQVLGEVKQESIVFVISALLRTVVLKDAAELDCLLILNVSLGDSNGVNTLLAELVGITFEVRRQVLSEEALQDAQVALVVDLGTRCEGLERLYHLDCQPVTLVTNLANNHLVIALKTALIEDSDHAVVSNLELVAISLSELEL